MSILDVIKLINYGFGALFFVCYAYQVIYMIVSTVKRPGRFPEAEPRRYAVMVAARNEENVIGDLIASIRAQKYPASLVDIYVAADNCTDSTAQVAREAGAVVFERFNKTHVGKGYALDFLFSQVAYAKPGRVYDAYLVFDADNLLDENFISEMNKTFAAGYDIVTCYRNSKNYGDNWVSAGSALWFLREARQLNSARMILGSSAAVSGTGFLVSHSIIEHYGGWKFFMLTEDIEFTMDNIARGVRIGYCDSAVVYDEQPTDISQSWIQRIRWSKGNIKCSFKYFPRLMSRFVKTGEFGAFDLAMTIMPALALTFIGIAFQVSLLVFTAFFYRYGLIPVILMLAKALLGSYLMAFAIGALTMATEWNNISCSAGKKLASLLTFPVFMLTYAPISVIAVFTKPEWKPIRHKVSVSAKKYKKIG